MYLNPLNFYYKPESPPRGLQSSPTACTASLIFASSKVPLPWHLPWIGSRSYQHAQYTCSTTSVPNHVSDCSITRYRNMAIWISWNIDIRGPFNCRDSFHRRKFENRAPTSCRPGPILSPPTISFELHAKWANDIDLEVCSYGQLSEVQMLLDLGSDQGHINIHSTCRTTSTPNHVTVASRITKIWPFEFRQTSTLDEVWTLVIAFLDGNSKIGLRQAVVQVPYYHCQQSLLSSTQKWRRR